MGKINYLGTDAGLHSYTTLKYVVITDGIIFNLWLQAKHAPYENKAADITVVFLFNGFCECLRDRPRFGWPAIRFEIAYQQYYRVLKVLILEI
jgi:hypothetical protein